jgi:uncharacterized DUF497 family protein
MALEFEWDASKAKGNATKHGVTFEEGLTVFRDPLANIFDDPDHSGVERRELIIGHSVKRRLLVVAYAERSGRIRLITARTATPRERHDYEQDQT